ncbi:hypothetical protein MNEG_12481 [Monoraphidium neglectum]|uniref:Peptidase M10 metallopeptidase domain-containing protein n=1 Tax=Monoraphidium neglectum TaxID=145388 RepID=A0A0D2MKQ1_9CHLO|nr:hypothetical protein MNEG_12481 [Monoraphidium neglectum]KIY95480.1 hypothetical protein MNEG_12481 [Monoraphidium neglectum]|eukprot:XP_013894500.1 hypothetical protein MNEG_12481 [Monoraphidium neglectum]
MAARIGPVALAAMTAFFCIVAGCMARKPDMPNVAWNENAAAAIGPDIAEVARNAGVDVRELVHVLNDRDIGYDKVNKRLLYACEGMAVPAGATPAAAPGSAVAGAPDPTDLSLAFKLHSRPGAPRRLVLDFTGHTTTGTAWNSATRPSIVTPPYDLDGVPSTFSDTERRNIIAIWRAVAEDFAAFDVDVTTEETDASGAQINLADNGARAVIGGSSYDWFGSGAGGVAYVNTFGNTYYDPAFVFPAQLGSGYPKYVWEATSHELGHRLGLSHDGDTLGNAYYGGSGIWAPIMGVSALAGRMVLKGEGWLQQAGYAVQQGGVPQC